MDEFVWSDTPGRMAFPVAKAGLPLIGGAAFATLILSLLGMSVMAVAGLAATFCICAFFRDPDRVTPKRTGAVVSPADGKVVFAGAADGGEFAQGECRRVSIFMSVFNVHVNRAPVSATVLDGFYTEGKFLDVRHERATFENEQQGLVLETASGHRLVVVQVAGLIARRIVCYAKSGDLLNRGMRYGLIRFGSRLDVYLPLGTTIRVKLGEKTVAGETIMGILS